MPTNEARYGAWTSPIDARLVARHQGRADDLGTVGAEVWWTVPRPEEAGRRALMRLRADSSGPAESVLPAPWNVRSRLMEYGGQPWAGAARPEGGPLIVFANFADQRLYAYEPDAPAPGPRPLTPLSAVGGGLRWADPVVLLERGEVWCVLEEFTGERPTDVRRVLAAVLLDGSAAEDRAAVRELIGSEHRFVTGPRLSPDGRRAAWLAWDHPQMPWDGTLLRLADIADNPGSAARSPGSAGSPDSAGNADDADITHVAADAEGGRFVRPRTVGGGPEESVAQVGWAADGSLLAVTDRTGWWNIHRIDPGTGHAANLCPREEEFADALWRVGQRWFAPMPGGLIAALHGRGALALGILDPETGELVGAPGPWTEWTSTLDVQDSRVIGVAASPRSGYEVVELDTATGFTRVIGAPHRPAVSPAYYPEPQIRTFADPQGRDIHAYIYPPYNPDHSAPDDELPPYVIRAHGGPTGRAPRVLDLEIAYFTSRGIGVAEVNYGGSTGYGRAYRNRLRRQWGIVDVEDCAAVAEALADEGTADRARLAIRGGSAGGWTAAASLTSAGTGGLYACGTISYPVLDLAAWAGGQVHDFESQYLTGLVGPPDTIPDRSRERSPIHHASRISVPFLLLQGLDDAICPPAQCERFLERMDGWQGGHAYLAFEGEGHGFRRADTIIRALEAELSLYTQVFGTARSDVRQLELSK